MHNLFIKKNLKILLDRMRIKHFDAKSQQNLSKIIGSKQNKDSDSMMIRRQRMD
jgi:hypothetical protein